MKEKLFHCEGFVAENLIVPAFDLHREEVVSILFQQDACDEAVLQAKFRNLISNIKTMSQSCIPLSAIMASDINIAKMLSERDTTHTIRGHVEAMIERRRLFRLVDDKGKGRRVEALNGTSLAVIALRLCLEKADFVIWDRLSSPVIHSAIKGHLKDKGLIELCPVWGTQHARKSWPNRPNSKVEIISQGHNLTKFWEYYADAHVVRTYSK